MISDRDFEKFLVLSAHSWISVEALRPEFPRWRRFLEARGFSEMPPLHSQVLREADAINHLTLLALQASQVRRPEVEHNLRNLTGVRPYKP